MTDHPDGPVPGEPYGGPTDTPGEAPGDGVVMWLDTDEPIIRLKMWGEWRELGAKQARGLAAALHEEGTVPAVYDVYGNPKDGEEDAVALLKKYATVLEAVENGR